MGSKQQIDVLRESVEQVPARGAQEVQEIRQPRREAGHTIFQSLAAGRAWPTAIRNLVIGLSDFRRDRSEACGAESPAPIAPRTARTRGGSALANRATRVKDRALDLKRSAILRRTSSSDEPGIERSSRRASSTARSSALVFLHFQPIVDGRESLAEVSVTERRGRPRAWRQGKLET